MPTSTGTYDTSTITYDQSSLSYDGYNPPLATMPAVGVFVAFDSVPYSTAPAWTEITPYVRDISIRRGRNDDTADFAGGTARLTLDNINRIFDPFNTSSIYNGKLQPRRPVKIVANWNSVEYQLYRGYIANWPVAYSDAGFDSTVDVECFDLMQFLGAEIINRNILEDYTYTLSPRYYWTFAESPEENAWYDKLGSGVYWAEAGTTIITTYSGSGSTYSSPWVNSGYKQVPELKPAAQSQAIMFRGVGSLLELYQNGTQLPSTAPTAGDFTMSFIVTIDTTTDTASVPFSLNTQGPFTLIRASTAPAGVVNVSAGGAPTRSESFGIYNLYGTKGAHVVITYVLAEKKFYIYIDGRLDLTSTGLLTNGTTGLFPIGYAYMLMRSAVGIQHMTWFDRVLTQNEIRLLTQVMLGKWEMSTINRANYYIAGTQVPAAFFNISSDIASNVSEMITEPSPLLPALRTLVKGEGGELFIDRYGICQFYSKNDVFNKVNSNTSQFTVTDSGTGVKYDAAGIRMSWDAETVRNDITVRGTDGQETATSDSTSIAAYGVAAEVVDTLLRDATETATLANRQLAVYKNPRVNIEPFTVKGQRDPSYIWPRVLDIELLEKFTFVRTPAVGSAFSQDMLVQSVEHRITPETWETVINGSARYANWFVLGVSQLNSDDLLI